LQACAFRDSYEKFKKAGAEVVGISGDDPSSHKVKPSFLLSQSRLM
jgi:peroxiredoxin